MQFKYIENIKPFENKMISLVMDGTTSRGRSLYFPGILKHFKLIQINDASGTNSKKKINTICDELWQNISVIGETTDNDPNLVKCFREIEQNMFENNYEFPILRFSCATHTCLLFIDDLEKTVKSLIQQMNAESLNDANAIKDTITIANIRSYAPFKMNIFISNIFSKNKQMI